MKKLFILGLALSATVTMRAQDAKTAWAEVYPQIERQIKAPVFPKKKFAITKYGAVADDPSRLNHKAINAAIDACSKAGGGMVVVPRGTWHTGPLTLKSNVNLHLDEGAVLLFTPDVTQYPFVQTRWEGMDCYNFQPMIYAYGEKNVAITGRGTIDGGASDENWWRMQGRETRGWKEGMPSQQVGRPKLMRWNDDRTPVDRRRLTPADGMRPQLVNLYRCDNVLIEGVTMLRPAFWTIHPLMCNNLTVRNVTIHSTGAPNGDGCDPESCNYVLIEGCYFDTGDDCIAIKSGRNNDGRDAAIPSQNMIIRKCQMKNGHGGAVIGSEISGGYKNLFVEDCEMDSPLLERVIRIKTNNRRGGVIENVYVRNIKVGQCKEAVLRINLTYDQKEVGPRDWPPVVRNVYVENVTCEKSRHGAFIDTYAESLNVENIFVENCRWNGVAEGNKFVGRMENVVLRGLYMNGELVKQ